MNHRPDSRWRTALHAVAVLGLMAACGGSDDAGSPPAPSGPVTFTQPVAFASDLTGVVTVQATSSDTATASIEFQIDGTALGVDPSAPYGTTVDSNTFASGQHVLRARAIDSAGQPSAWTPLTVQFGGTRTQPAGFTRNEGFASGLSAATAFTQLPDGRLLVAQQGGALRVLQSNGTVIGTLLSVVVDSQGERGLLGVTPHPDFTSNGFIYVYYTTTQGGTHNRISRFTVSGNTAGGEVPLVDLPALSTAQNHNGGAIHFGSDGKLYVGVGENNNGALAQNLNSPLGKLLRFNDDGSIPGDNPFCTTAGNLACAVWAYGLRNPFTFAVQPGTDRIHINDVGQATWEEIDVAARGANFGWPGSEGPSGVTGNITGPLFTYNHDAASPPGSGPGGFFTGNVIAGGTFYPNTGPFPPPYRGNYFFADSGAAFIGMLDLANGNAAYLFGQVSGNPVDMLVASDGALLVLTRSNIVRFSTP